jgi:3,4-dihydroxy 2-butanone 4-phosphate synthase/GTP cyclohydrolase II
MSLHSIPEIIADIKAGRMVILVDEEDRENEGDLVMGAEFVTPEAVNFMAKHGRGLICLTLTEQRCRQLNLPPMVRDNRSPLGTAFTVSIEAARGVTTGISAQDRAQTVKAAVAPNAVPEDVVQPGHVFPLMAQPGGVLVRAGHTEAGCDLAGLAGLMPAAVICEILNDDGTMARLPDLLEFCTQHGIKIGSIADLIRFRSEHESLIKRVTERAIETAFGSFRLLAYIEKNSGKTHLALVKGKVGGAAEALVRVHEPLSLLDLLDTGPGRHSWTVHEAMERVAQEGSGVIVLLNCSEESAGQLIERVASTDRPEAPPKVGLLTYGIGAQILRDLKVKKMRLMASQRKMPSMVGWDLEVTGYVLPERNKRQRI